MYVAERLIMPIFGNYKSVNECYNDRVNHRLFWYNTIREYTKDNPSKLVEEIYQEYDILWY